MNNCLFNVAHVNVLSLLPKFEIVKNFILDNQYDLFAMSETWLNSSITNEQIDIHGYTLIRKDRDTRGGGVAFYLRDSYLFNIIETNDGIEQLWIAAVIGNSNFIFGVCYNPPRNNAKLFTDDLEETIVQCMQYGDRIYCFGDVNINMLDTSLSTTRYFLNMLESLEFYQVVSEATHVTANSASLLDIIICSDLESVSSVKVGGLAVSNHDLIQCKIAARQSKFVSRYVTYRDFKHFVEDQFYFDLQQLPIADIFYINDVDAKVNHISALLLQLFDKHVPLRTVRICRKKAPWLTDHIKSLMKQRDKAKRDCKRNPSQAKWAYYKQIRNVTNRAQNVEKLAYFQHLAISKNSKRVWAELKSLNIMTSSNKSPLPQNLSNADDINNHFIDCIPQSTSDTTNILNYYNLNKITTSSFSFNLVSTEQVHHVSRHVLPLKRHCSEIRTDQN